MTGNTIEITVAAFFSGSEVALGYSGAVDATGMLMRGSVTVTSADAEGPFTGQKAP